VDQEVSTAVSMSAAKTKLFELARQVALTSQHGKFRHGAVLVKRSTVLALGCNDSRPTRFGKRFRAAQMGQATVHAELACVLNAPRSATDGADVYVVRVNPSGELRNSKPCEMCQAALKFVGVRRVLFSTSFDGQFEWIKL
jgi:deoxycytidylate deaminase